MNNKQTVIMYGMIKYPATRSILKNRNDVNPEKKARTIRKIVSKIT